MIRDRWLLGALAATAAGTVLAWRTTQEGSILGNSDRLLLEVLGWWLAWAVGIACLVRARRADRRTLLLAVLLGAVALRLAAITVVVPLSDDLYRYAWDGKVQASGTSPYRHAPTSDALDGLHDAWLWPDEVECGRRGREAGCTVLNRADDRTIYPPVAQLWFLGGHLAGASELRDLGWQLVGLVADVVTALLLWRVLVARGRDPRWVAVYAWSPVAVLEAVQNGHVDALATAFVVAAVALAGRRPGWSGAALGAAAMVKLYPALLLPVLLGRRPVRVVTAFVAVCAVSYLPHVLAVGWDVLGYLPGYLAEEGYDEGDRYLLVPGGTAVAVAVGLAVLAVVVLRVRREPDDVAGPALLLLGAALLVATPVQPWYGLPVAALAVLARRPEWLAVPAAAYVAFFPVIVDGPGPDAAAQGTRAYAAALAVVLASAAVRRYDSGRASTISATPTGKYSASASVPKAPFSA